MVPNPLHAFAVASHHVVLSFTLLCLMSSLSSDLAGIGALVRGGGGSGDNSGATAGSLGGLFLFAGATFSPKDYLKREHSLVKPYHGSAWDYGGTTMVTSNYVRLTSDKPSQAGFVWNRVPCHLR